MADGFPLWVVLGELSLDETGFEIDFLLLRPPRILVPLKRER